MTPLRIAYATLALGALLPGGSGTAHAALSREMWVQISAIYATNLRNDPECQDYAKRAERLLRDPDLGREELQSALKALWHEAKRCLAPAPPPSGEAAGGRGDERGASPPLPAIAADRSESADVPHAAAAAPSRATTEARVTWWWTAIAAVVAALFGGAVVAAWYVMRSRTAAMSDEAAAEETVAVEGTDVAEIATAPAVDAANADSDDPFAPTVAPG